MTMAADEKDLANVIINCSDVGATDFPSCYCKKNNAFLIECIWKCR